jgi:glyoxylase-like metal-dependent hydrolase (beta-lactamase superfamily II)
MTGEKAELQKLAEGVYAFVGKLNDANAMAIVTTQGVIVVDTGNNPPETRILLKDIQSVTAQPARYVVITQNHGDHTGGHPPVFAARHGNPARSRRQRLGSDEGLPDQVLAEALSRARTRACRREAARHGREFLGPHDDSSWRQDR